MQNREYMNWWKLQAIKVGKKHKDAVELVGYSNGYWFTVPNPTNEKLIEEAESRYNKGVFHPKGYLSKEYVRISRDDFDNNQDIWY